MRRQAGFTLVELVMVIALAGIVAVMISTVLVRPMQGLIDQSRRAELVDQTSLALSRMARDIRLAVPNSVRVQGGDLELLRIHAAGRYLPNRAGAEGLRFAPGNASDCTVPGNDCQSFAVLDPALPVASARWLVLYNVGAESGGVPVVGSNLWAAAAADGRHVISPSGSSLSFTAGTGQGVLRLVPPGGSFAFSFASPQRRFYLADEVVGLSCDLANRRLLRYTRITLAPAFSAAQSEVLASDVTRCAFSYQPGNQQRAGLVSLSLGLSRDGESVELLQQVQVDNAP